MKCTFVVVALTVLVSACVSQPVENLAQSKEDLVRGTPDEDYSGVIGVVSLYVKDGSLRHAVCSGTYVAPRLVLTAAHCMPENRYVTKVFYGTDLKSAYDTLDWWAHPAPGEPWALAEAFKVHPDFNTDTYFADIGVVFLDRELPVPVTPIAKRRLEDRKIGELGTLVGFGATSSDQMLTETTGWGLRRVGKSSFLGSPAAGMQTDHPGIGLEAVRDSLAMFDGHAPYANACAGDSGGPVLMKHGGKDHVFGVSSWTGYYCEDYSLYTRIDPFVSFIETSAKRAGRGPVTPTIECVRPLAGGGTRVYFGYDNANDVSLDIPYGDDNRMRADTAGIRPTHFLPGRQHYAMAADYSHLQNPLWKIESPSGHTRTVSGCDAKPQCAADDFALIAADACVAMGGAHCGQSISECVADQLWQYDPSDPTYCPQQFADYLKCQGTLPADQFQCDGSGYYAWDVSTTCLDAQNAYWACLFGL